LKAELNPICHLLALLRTHHILHVSRIRVKPITGSDGVKYRKTNGVSVVNFATSKIVIVKSMVFPIETFINTPGPILVGRVQWRLVGLS
jgi:hypothetical protein